MHYRDPFAYHLGACVRILELSISAPFGGSHKLAVVLTTTVRIVLCLTTIYASGDEGEIG